MRAATRIPSIEQLPCKQLLEARDLSERASKGVRPQNLLTNLLTPKALEPHLPAFTGFLRDYTLSLLSSRSLVRIQQGASSKSKPDQGFCL